MPDFFALYQPWQVQLVRNALAAMLAAGVAPQDLLIQADAALAARPVAARPAEKPARPSPACPSCGGARVRMLVQEGLLINACYDCRWSGIINTEVRHGA